MCGNNKHLGSKGLAHIFLMIHFKFHRLPKSKRFAVTKHQQDVNVMYKSTSHAFIYKVCEGSVSAQLSITCVNNPWIGLKPRR